jgi:hypothetical protein
MWILVCATTPQPFDLYDYYAYVGIYGVRPPAQLALIPGLDPAPSTNHLFQRQLPYADMLSNMAHNCYMGSSRHNLDQGQDLWNLGARGAYLRYPLFLYRVRSSYRPTGLGPSSLESKQVFCYPRSRAVLCPGCHFLFPSARNTHIVLSGCHLL